MSQNTSVLEPQAYSDIVSRIRKGMVPRFELAADRPTDEKDFENHKPNSLEALQFTLSFSESQSLIDISQDSTLQKQILVPMLILCFENMSKVQWNDINHIQLSYKVLSQLKRRIFLSESLCQALVNFDKSDKLLRWCLLELRPKLEHKLWVQHPGAQQAFVVLINQISFPVMGQYASEFLPFTLQFVDHWDVGHITTGTLCLQHIVNELTPSELKWFGRGELITNALIGLMHVKEPNFHDILFPCIAKTINKSIGPKDNFDRYAKLDDWDHVFQKYLLTMSIETNLDLKRSYAKHLALFVSGLRVGVVRWLSKVVSISEAYLAIPAMDDLEETRLSVLHCLKIVMHFAKPRIESYSKEIFEQLLRLLHESSKDSFNCPLLRLSATEAFLFLVEISHMQFLSLCKGLDKVSVNDAFDEAIKQGFNVAKAVAEGGKSDLTLSDKIEDLSKKVASTIMT